MMTSLMSIFDPCCSIHYLSSWLVVLLSIFLLKTKVWLGSSSSSSIMGSMFNLLMMVFGVSKVVFTSLIMFILLMNLLGLSPFVFSPTSHLSFNISLSLTFWLGMMIWYLYKNMKSFLAHLTPQGCPMMLMPFMVLIELISSLIRPLTLALRLMANVMAGHMILTLISKGVMFMNIMIIPSMFVVSIGFLLFECGVAVIQAYVFSSLMSLYWEESL